MQGKARTSAKAVQMLAYICKVVVSSSKGGQPTTRVGYHGYGERERIWQALA